MKIFNTCINYTDLIPYYLFKGYEPSFENIFPLYRMIFAQVIDYRRGQNKSYSRIVLDRVTNKKKILVRMGYPSLQLRWEN